MLVDVRVFLGERVNLQEKYDYPPNCFVGALPRRAVEQLWAVVLDADPKAALLVVPARNELGLRLLAIGEYAYTPVEHFGIQLVAARKGGKLPPAP